MHDSSFYPSLKWPPRLFFPSYLHREIERERERSSDRGPRSNSAIDGNLDRSSSSPLPRYYIVRRNLSLSPLPASGEILFVRDLMLPPFLRLLAPIIFLPSRLPFVISSFDRDFQRSMVIRYPRRRIQRFLRLSRLRIEIGSSSNFRRSSGEIIFFFRFLSISFDDRLSRVVPLLWIVSRIIFDPLCHCRHRERERER